MKHIALLILIIPIIFAVGCEPRIDASSEEALQASVQEVKKSLPEDKQEAFEKALLTISFADLNLGAMMAGLQNDKTLIEGAREKLNGKTAAEIFALAEEIQKKNEKEQAERDAKQQAEQLEQIHKEIVELEEAEKHSKQASAQLAKFKVERSRFYKKPQRYGPPEPVIELKVHNDTDIAISRAYFKGTYATPGRSVPWLEDTFNYSISGGLEPGEVAEWSLAPNMFSAWGKVEEKDDAVFTVEVIRLDGPDGEPAHQLGFSDADARRLKKLREKIK